MEVVYRPDLLLPTLIAAVHLLRPDQHQQHQTSSIALHLPLYLSLVIYDRGKVGDLPTLLHFRSSTIYQSPSTGIITFSPVIISTPVRLSRDTSNSSRPSLEVNGPSYSSSVSSQSAYSPLPSRQASAPGDRSASPASSNRTRTKKDISKYDPVPSEAPQPRREVNTRVSFFDPANQAYPGSTHRQ